MTTASARILQLVRAHYRGDEQAFAGAATQLARAAKSDIIRRSLTEAIREEGRVVDVRLDTGEEVFERAMTAAELQGELPFDGDVEDEFVDPDDSEDAEE